METALGIGIALGLTLVIAGTAVVLCGWFPRLAALGANGLDRLFAMGKPQELTPQERSELIARLWVP